MRFRLGIIVALACCTLAACSNSTGGGTATLPGGQLPPLANPQTPAPVPTATPNTVNGNVLVGDGTVQTLQAPGDFRVTAVFPQSSASPLMLKVTVSVKGPGGILPYGDTGKKGLFGKKRTLSPALLYVWFSSDKDVTVSGLPTLTFTVPVNALEPFGTDPNVDLALYDPANESKWMQQIAERQLSTPSPTPSPNPKVSATASPTPSPSPSPTPTPTPTPARAPGVPAPQAAVTPFATAAGPVSTLTYRFTPTARTMKLLAKKNLVFVLYAEPASTPAPSASPRGSASPSSSASPSGSASPSASSSPSASPSPSPKPSGS